MGLYGAGGHVLVPLPEREKSLFLVRIEKKVCTGEKNHSPQRIIWSTPKETEKTSSLCNNEKMNRQAVIDIQDFAALALQASYNSAGLAQKKKTLALIENKFTCPGQA